MIPKIFPLVISHFSSFFYMILECMQLSKMIYVDPSPDFFFLHLLNRRQEILETSWGISRPQQNLHAHPSSGQLHPSFPAAVVAFTALREDKLVTQAGKLGLTHAEKLSSVKGIWHFNLFLQTSHCPYQKLIATVPQTLSTQTIYIPH